MRVCGDVVYGSRTFYLRTLSAKQDELRQAYATKAAREYRVKLRDTGSEEHLLHIVPLKEATREELAQLVLNAEERRLVMLAVAEVDPEKEAQLPDNADIGDVLDTEEEQERLDKDTEERRRAWVKEMLDGFRAEHIDGDGKWSDTELLSKATEEHIKTLSLNVFSNTFQDASLLYGVYADKGRKKPYFTTLDEVSECDSRLRMTLVVEYFRLDEASRDASILKN